MTIDDAKIDEDKIDDAVLALLFLTLGRDGRAWKGHDWAALGRLHDKGMIGNPVGKAKSVWLTEEGVARSEELFRAMFSRETPRMKPREVFDEVRKLGLRTPDESAAIVRADRDRD